MQALVYEAPWRVDLAHKEPPADLAANEVLVRIESTGVCGTDIGIVSGVYDAVPGVTLGHESSGVVAKVGDNVRTVTPGDRVVIDPTYFCGYCRLCRTGRSNHCEHKFGTETGVSQDGTFAPYYKTTERFLHTLADDVSFDAATLTEPLSCALTGVDQLRTRSDLRAVVLGAGPMGILYTHALATKGVSGVVIDLSAARRDLAEGVVAAHWRCGGATLEEAARQVAPGDGKLDLVVDTTGVLASQALPYLARGGQFLAVGLRPHVSSVDMRRIADESLSILGSIDSLGTFGAAAHLINSHVIPADAIVTNRLPLSEFRQAFHLLGYDINAQQGGHHAQSIKVVLRPGA